MFGAVVKMKHSTKKNIGLDESALLGQLEELARSLGIQVRFELIRKEGASSTGGLCRLKGEYILIINSKASLDDKIQTLAMALNRFDISQVYLKPGLREFLDKFPVQTQLALEQD